MADPATTNWYVPAEVPEGGRVVGHRYGINDRGETVVHRTACGRRLPADHNVVSISDDHPAWCPICWED